MTSVTAVSSRLAQPAQTVEELLRENAQLRAHLSLTDEQRVTEEVLHAQLEQFFASVAQEERAAQKSLTASTQLDEENATENATVASSALTQATSEVLYQMQLGRQQAEAALEKLQLETVAPLRAQLEAAETEKVQLSRRIADLEMSMASTPAPPLVAELEQLRQSEALLRHQLSEAQHSAAGTVEAFGQSMQGGLAAANRVPELVNKVEALREELRASHDEQAVLRVRLEERDRQHKEELEMVNASHGDQTAVLKERISDLEAEVAAAAVREAEVVAELDATHAQLIAAQSQIRELIAQHGEEQQALAQKRQRAEVDASSDPSSIRAELTKFWYDGRDRIRDLERQISAQKVTQADLRVSQDQVKQLDRRLSRMAMNLAEVATEVDRLRSEERDLRAHCAGLQAERDRLLTSVAMTVGTVMSESELRECCATIREAATRAAATSATVVADPQAIEEALRRSQRLKSEVAQLQRQRDQLQRFVQLSEDRVRALIAQEGLARSEPQQRVSSSTPSASSSTAAVLPSAHTPPSSGGAPFSLFEFMEYTRQCANDVFLLNETTAAQAVAGAGAKQGVLKSSTAGGAEAAGHADGSLSRHRDSFVALQQQLQQSQRSLLMSQRELLEARNENRHLQAELDSSRSEHAAATALQDKVRSAVQADNAALMSRNTTLTSELQAMQQHYAVAVGMVSTTLEGLRSTLQLYHQSEQHGEQLREMVQAERRDMSDLLRREAASWGVEGGSSEGGEQAAQHSAAADKITAALQQMEAYITEAVQQTALQASQEQTSYIGQLVGAIREQEERVKEAKAAFEAAAQAQASSLVKRITAAQQQWESTWRAKYQAMEAERAQSTMQQRASDAVQRALEQAVAPPAGSAASASASGAAALAVTEEAAESSARMTDTLQTIRSFMAQAQQRQEQQRQEQERQEQERQEQQRQEEQRQEEQRQEQLRQEQREKLQRLQLLRQQQLEEQQRQQAAAAAAAAAAAVTIPTPEASEPPAAVDASAPAVQASSPLTPASPAPSLVSAAVAAEPLPASTADVTAANAEPEQPATTVAEEDAPAESPAVVNEEEATTAPAQSDVVPEDAAEEEGQEQELPADTTAPAEVKTESAAADAEEAEESAQASAVAANEEAPSLDTSSPE